jgi:TonB family protein
MRCITWAIAVQGLIILSYGISRADTCQGGPQYKVGLLMTKDKSRIVQNVSIAPEYFTRRKLACLAIELENRYSSERVAFFNIFDDQYPATQRPEIPSEAKPKDLEIYQHEHASIYWSRETGERYLTLQPDIWNEETHTKLQLPLLQSSNCSVQIGQNRCLVIIARHLRYPEQSWRRAETGSVEVAITVGADGVVTQAAIVDGQSASESLCAAALADARNWRFEPGSGPENLKVAYSFQLSGAPDNYIRDKVQYDLPNQVVVTANPSR